MALRIGGGGNATLAGSRSMRGMPGRYDTMKRLDRQTRMELFRSVEAVWPHLGAEPGAATPTTPVQGSGESPSSGRNSIADIKSMLTAMPGASEAVRAAGGGRMMHSPSHRMLGTAGSAGPRPSMMSSRSVRRISDAERNAKLQDQAFDLAFAYLAGGNEHADEISPLQLARKMQAWFPGGDGSDYKSLCSSTTLAPRDKGIQAGRASAEPHESPIDRTALKRLLSDSTLASPQEAVREAFRALDPFDTGVIWPEMLAVWLERSTDLGTLSSDDLAELTALTDLDRDGVISLDDWCDFLDHGLQQRQRDERTIEAHRDALEADALAALAKHDDEDVGLA